MSTTTDPAAVTGSARNTTPCSPVIVWAPDRTQALVRMDRALTELFLITGRGVVTTVGFHRSILRNPAFRGGTHATDLIGQIAAVRTIETAAPREGGEPCLDPPA
jgi:acetyl/propionyl-CoA carboxylase alpha subunit